LARAIWIKKEVIIMALNHVTIQGRFVRDPELRRTSDAKAVASFTVAVDKPGKDRGASFLSCVAWDKTAEFIDQYFTKGSPVIVEGRLDQREYETKEGQKRTVVEVVVTQAHFCGKKEESVPEGAGRTTAPAPAQQFTMLEGDDSALPF
jgi:single-strand DNA-binding protein